MLTNTAPLLQSAGALSLILLSILSALSTVHSDTVVQDPMQAQANSFGWLAIRNFTYCLSSSPDPPDKPRGVQPTKRAFADQKPSKQLTGIGDSVVVLYHPENTNKAIAWCNTLVAFQSTEHVKCHIALPTCQRCDAVRDVTTAAANPPARARQVGRENKAPSGRLGQPRTYSKQMAPSNDNLVPLRRRDALANDPNDPHVNDPAATDPNAKPPTTPQPRTGTPSAARPNSRLHSYDPSVSVDQDATNDPQLEAAISEFQDYCENKLTLAVRADCPLHIVQSWTDEPPFDLHRFCMSLRSLDGYTLHLAGDADSGSADAGGGDGGGDAQQGGAGQQRDAKGAALIGTAAGAQAGTGQKPGSGNGRKGNTNGVMDPEDPVVPYPFQNAG